MRSNCGFVKSDAAVNELAKLPFEVGGLVGFNAFRTKMITQFFANNKPPPASVSVAEAKSEVIPNLLAAVGDLERQVCEFILRGIGLNETAVASHLGRELSPAPGQPVTAEGA